MFRVPQLIRTQCRHDLRPPLASASQLLSRSRSGASTSQAPPKSFSKAPFKPSFKGSGKKYGFRRKEQEPEPEPEPEDYADIRKAKISAADVPDYFAENASNWAAAFNQRIVDRLARFGVPKEHIQPLLKTYTRAVEEGAVFRDLNYPPAQLERIAYDVSTKLLRHVDEHCTKILYEWANTPEGQARLERTIPPEIVTRMQGLYRAADLSDIAWEYSLTRRSRPRKFIMHVGPTNSGKTHNALRALAAAKRGIYAGPLRLLAYEIYDRLNKGQIVPLGVEPDPADEPDSQSNIDLGEAAVMGKSVVVTKSGNPKYARPCNMVTGEEQKIVDDNAPLLSCTVEMTPHLDTWDVAVIDEIQLIADQHRGGAWTAAVIGVNAAEIHLCGEESAIPVIEAIVRDLGDSLEINRYERLTPLVVAEKSLGGDLKRIQKGDCAVAFSRTGIFGMKSRIEEKTKMRCALAYGRLPPEIRSEQAALFNDPNSGYDVLVGSDAIGMGLNLKIKRIVFESVSKFDGGRSRVMTSSQIKQIAGRAGRFGLHGDDSPGGVVTTLRPGDLEIVRKALVAPYDPIRYARITMGLTNFLRVVRALPPGFSQATVTDAFVYVSKLHPCMQYHSVSDLSTCFAFIDQFRDCLTLENRLLAQNAPCPWRDANAVRGTQALMELHREKFRVSLEAALQRADILKNLNQALVMMEDDRLDCDTKEIISQLGKLETIHKVIVLYLWYSYRFSVAFPDQALAFELRNLTEVAMDWCLEVLHQMRINAENPTAAARKAVLERRSAPKKGAQPTVAVTDNRGADDLFKRPGYNTFVIR